MGLKIHKICEYTPPLTTKKNAVLAPGAAILAAPGFKCYPNDFEK
jgi:hypothetical protein